MTVNDVEAIMAYFKVLSQNWTKENHKDLHAFLLLQECKGYGGSLTASTTSLSCGDVVFINKASMNKSWK